MKSREELQREFAGNPAGLLEYTCQLHEQLSQKEQLLAAIHQELARQEQSLAEVRACYRRTQVPTLWPQGRQA